MWKLLLVLLLCFDVNPHEMKDPLIFDFGLGKDFGSWSIVNDGVMGGLSQSKASIDDDALLFTGNVSLKNNGGFVSLRSPMGNYDLSTYSYCEIRFKSDTERKFEVLIEKDTPFYLPKFRVKFAAGSKNWQTVTIPLRDFEISRMGTTIQKGIEPEALKGIQRIGFILAEKQEGTFNIWIDYLKFY
jgi:NADH dehydrogenase [ubiquinone] 1 alpha subcomplex assembly factor 1